MSAFPTMSNFYFEIFRKKFYFSVVCVSVRIGLFYLSHLLTYAAFEPYADLQIVDALPVLGHSQTKPQPVDIADSPSLLGGPHQLLRSSCHGTFFPPSSGQKFTLSAASEALVTAICHLI